MITRTDTSNNVTQIVNVPIQYAQKEKMMTRMLSDPGINREDAIILPAISFEIKDISYDETRKLNTIGRNFSNLSNTSVSMSYNPVPYDIHFDLYIYVKNNEDATKIIEQIVPFFTPDFTIITTMFPNVPAMAVPIILDGVKIDEENNDNFADRTIIKWNLGFTLKGYFYGPVKTTPVINLANLNFSVWTGTFSNNIYQDFGLSNFTDNNIISNTTVTDVVINGIEEILITTSGQL